MSLVSRNWFYQITKTAIKRGLRFKNGDRPEEATFVNLTDSVVMKSEVGDRAKEDSAANASALAGHVVASTDVQAKAFQTKKTDRTLVVQPSQLPEVSLAADQTVGDFVGKTITATVDPTATTRNKYLLQISDSFLSWLLDALASVGISFASNAEILANSAVDAAVKPNQLPTSSQAADDTILGFTGKTVAVTKVGSTDHNNYTFGLTTAFKNFLASALTPVSTGSIYISPNGNDTTGNGSITSPYKTIQKGIDVSDAMGINKLPIIVLGGTYAVTVGLSSFDKNIYFSPGAIVTFAPSTANYYLFTATTGFSVTGFGEFTLNSANVYFIKINSTTSTIRLSAKEINSYDALFNIAGVIAGGDNSKVILTDTKVSIKGNIVRNLFISAVNTGNTNSTTLLPDLTGASFKFINCDFSGFFVGVTNFNYGSISLSSNCTWFGTNGGFPTMSYFILGAFANSAIYSFTIDNTIFDNASRSSGSNCIKLNSATTNIVLRNVVFDRGATLVGSYSIDATVATTIRAAQTLDTLPGVGPNITNAITGGITNIQAQTTTGTLFNFNNQ